MIYIFLFISFLVNATLNSAVSSPLESPDIMQSFMPMSTSDMGAATTSMASIKLSADSLNNRSQQVRSIRLASLSNATLNGGGCGIGDGCSGRNGSMQMHNNSKSSSLRTIHEAHHNSVYATSANNNNARYSDDTNKLVRFHTESHQSYTMVKPMVEFSISSVGRSFIDESDEIDNGSLTNASLKTPDTPTPNISPSSSNRYSETFSNDFLKMQSPDAIVSPNSDQSSANNDDDDQLRRKCDKYSGSWDLLELDLDFHDVNFDPSFGGDLEESEFLGDVDDPLGLLPRKPTAPDTHNL